MFACSYKCLTFINWLTQFLLTQKSANYILNASVVNKLRIRRVAPLLSSCGRSRDVTFAQANVCVELAHSHIQMYICVYMEIFNYFLFCHIIGIISMYVYAEYSYIIYIHIDACMYMLLCISKTCVCVCKCFQCHDSWHSVTRLCACCKLKLIVFMHKKFLCLGILELQHGENIQKQKSKNGKPSWH